MTATTDAFDAWLQRQADERGLTVGRVLRLPASFQGSKANMQKCYEDAMASVKHHGKPDLFITITTNPSWPEIVEHLTEGQHYWDRPDICVTVFYEKLRNVLRLIESGVVFGPVLDVVVSIEFQKRGLPHAHIVVFLATKIRTPEQVDAFISAEIPDEDLDPQLHAMVTRHMLHNLCGERRHGAVCMARGRCRKRYPKAFRNETVINDGTNRVGYMRRDNAVVHIDRTGLRNNRHVVTFNPYLLKYLDCHVNVDAIANYASLKYIFKYIFKGNDALVVRTRVVDEQLPPQVGAVVEANVRADMVVPNIDRDGEADDRFDGNSDDDLPHSDDEGEPMHQQQSDAVPNQPDLPSSTQDTSDSAVPARPPRRNRGESPEHAQEADGPEQNNVAPPLQNQLDYDETVQWFNSRTITSMEAAWRIKKYWLHYQRRHVQILQVHDETGPLIRFQQGHEMEAARERAEGGRVPSTLEAAFLLYDGPHRQLALERAPLYSDLPNHFVYQRR